MSNENRDRTTGPIYKKVSTFITVSILLGSLTACGWFNQKDKETRELEAFVEKIEKQTGLKRVNMQELGVTLDTVHRLCTTRAQPITNLEKRFAKINKCFDKNKQEVLAKYKIDVKESEKIRKAHVKLRWELKEFLKAHKETNLPALKKIFAAGMKHQYSCEASFRKKHKKGSKRHREPKIERKIEVCWEAGFYAECEKGGFQKDDCGKLISMGLDYNWPSDKNERTITNPELIAEEMKKY